MLATSCQSAPASRAISTMDVAAPGIEPQIATVGGSTCQRSSVQPIATLAASVAAVTPAKSHGCTAT